MQSLQSSAQKHHNTEDFCSIIIETRLLKATESPEKSQRCPIVVPKLAGNFRKKHNLS